MPVIFLIFTVLSVYFCHSVITITSEASSPERSDGGTGKGRRVSLQLRLCNLNSTSSSPVSSHRLSCLISSKSGRRGNERERNLRYVNVTFD